MSIYYSNSDIVALAERIYINEIRNRAEDFDLQGYVELGVAEHAAQQSLNAAMEFCDWVRYYQGKLNAAAAGENWWDLKAHEPER